MDLSLVDVFDYLERLDMRNVRSASGGSEANFSCPFDGHSHGDESPSAYMNVETALWFCWGCKRRGDAVSFYTEAKGVSRAEAERFLRDNYGVDFLQPQGGSMVAETTARFAPVAPPAEPLRPSESFLNSIAFDWEHEPLGEPHHYLTDRGFELRTLNHWNVGYDYISDRPAFPVRNIAGELIGVKGRAWRVGQEPKYLVLGDRAQTRYGFEPYDPSHVVYGLERNRDEKTVVLCEGELNAWALWQVGVPRPVATGMSYFSPSHMKLLIREATHVIVFYDTDDAGMRGTWGYVGGNGKRTPGIVELLEPHITVSVVADHDSDPAQMVQEGNGQEALDLVAGARRSLALSTSFR